MNTLTKRDEGDVPRGFGLFTTPTAFSFGIGPSPDWHFQENTIHLSQSSLVLSFWFGRRQDLLKTRILPQRIPLPALAQV
jgi:hypothetical protein